MPLWRTEYTPFTPPDIPGLVAWYDSNSTVLSNNGTTVLSLRDKYIYNNNLISYIGAITSSNVASNLLPNSGSITRSVGGCNIVLSNAVMTSTRGILEFQYRTTGATVFVCGDFETRSNSSENYLSIFTRNYSNPSEFNNSLSIGTVNRGGLFSNFFVNVHDLSNTTTTSTNLTPIVIGWFDANRNITTAGGTVSIWNNNNTSFANHNLGRGHNFTPDGSAIIAAVDTITVLSNNPWTGEAAELYGCNAANVLNFPYATGYSYTAGNRATTAPQLNARIDALDETNFIRAVAFVVNYDSNALTSNYPNFMGNVISATFVPWTIAGSYYRTGYQDTGYSSFNANDLIWCSNTESTDGTGTFGGGLWINGSNVFNPRTASTGISGGFGALTRGFDLRSSFNIVFARFGEVRQTGIGISGIGGVTNLEGTLNSRSFYGQVGDVIVLGSNYTTRDQENVEGYLAQKYNLLGKLRSDHPFKSGYRSKYPFAYYENSILTGIAFNNCNTVAGSYTTGYLNGRPVSRNSNLNILTTNRANFNMFVGDSCNYTARDGFTHNINTPIKEIIVYNRPISAFDVGRVHGYLQGKYNIPSLHNNGNFSY
jgi:hypothetical protein